MEKDFAAGRQREVRPLQDKVSAGRQARDRRMRKVSRKWRLQKDHSLPEVHGLPQGCSQGTVREACRWRRVFFVSQRTRLEAVAFHRQGTRLDQVSAPGRARTT